MNSHHLGVAARIALPLTLLACALCAAACLDSSPRGRVEVELRAPPYPRPRCAKGPLALGKLHPRGEPIAGARVELQPGGFVGITDADGRLALEDVPAGSYTLRLAAPGYVPLDPRALELAAGANQRVALNLTPCVFGGEDRHRVGFGTRLALMPSSLCGEEWEDATYTWAQVEGPDISGSVESWTERALRFTTAAIDDLRELPEQPRVLSFSPDEAGQYVFRLVARRADGVLSQDYVYVTSTNVAGGVTSVPPNEDFYFLGQRDGPWSWSLMSWPDGWVQTLEGESRRTPHVRLLPDDPIKIQESLVLYEAHSQLMFKLVVGDWNLVNRDCGTAECHPTLQPRWEATRHGMTWKRLLDGELTSARGELADSCAACHALGHDTSPLARNGGYDDVARLFNVTVPDEPRPGVYDALPQAVKDVSNVYCLACHGPARVDPPVAEQPGRFGVGVCAQCHDRLPEQDLVAQWRTSRMAQIVTSDPSSPAAKEECKRCHSAQGFYYENFALGRPPSGDVAVLSCCDNLEPITCQACHSPMYALNDAQIFRHGSVRTESGLELQGIGSGALCATCHNTEHDVQAAPTAAARLAPHAPQSDLGYGRAGYVLDAPQDVPIPAGAACFRDAGDGCVTCHMEEGPAYGEPGHRQVGDHTFHMVSTGGVENTRPCLGCHEEMPTFNPRARHDYDGNARVERVREEVDGLMVLLRQRLSAAIAERGYVGCQPQARGAWVKAGFRLKLVVTDELGFDLGDCDRNGVIERAERPFLFPAADELLHKAAYNYLLIEADKSRGLHNLPYTVTLLQRTLHAITEGKGLPSWDTFQARPAR